MAGLDVEQFLAERDNDARVRTLSIARAATALRHREHEHLAVQIANMVVKAFGGS